MTATANFRVNRGDSLRINFTATGSDGQPIPVNQPVQARFEFALARAGTNHIELDNHERGGVSGDAQGNGMVVVESTEALQPGHYDWAVRVVMEDGSEDTQGRGLIWVREVARI